MAKDAESGADAVVFNCKESWPELYREQPISDPYKSYLDYGLAYAALSIKASLGIGPETKVKVTILMPSVE